MDWARFMRASQVTSILHAEDRRRAFLGGSASNISDAEWQIVSENDELLRRWG